MVNEIAEPLVGYRAYPMRWVVLLQFCMTFAGNALQWVTFSLVVDQSKSDFGMSVAQVNFLATDYEVVYALLAGVVMAAYKLIGLRGTLRITSALNILGVACRVVAALWCRSYGPVLLAQTLFSAAMSFILAAPPIVSSRWFPENERTLATAIGSMANSLGLALAQLIPPLIVTPSNHSVDRWVILFAVLGAPFLFDAILIFFVIPVAPPTPPSAAESLKGACVSNPPADDFEDTDSTASADDACQTNHRRRSIAETEVDEHLSQIQQLGRIFQIRPFVLLFVAAGIFFGSQWSVISLITQILKPFGFSEATVGWMGFCGTTIGAFASLPMGSWIDKKRVYREPLALALSIFSLTFFAIATVLYFDLSHSLVTVFALYVASGIAQSCCVPLFFEMCVELTYPYDETLATTSVMWAGNAFCVPLMYAVPAIIGNDPTPASGVSALAAVSIVSAVAAMLIGLSNPRYKRLEYEMSLQIPSA